MQLQFTTHNISLNAKNSAVCIVQGRIVIGLQFGEVIAENDLQQKILQQ